MDVNSNSLNPVPLGLKRSFGFGDRLGLAGPGHIAASGVAEFAPIFAQQSIREMTRTDRTPEEVINAAREALAAAEYSKPWGADADHLKTEEDVKRTAAAGFCFFTIDPSEFVQNAADTMKQPELETEIAEQNAEGLYYNTTLEDLYLDKQFEAGGTKLAFDRESLLRAGVKYGRAIAHCEKMAHYIAEANPERLYEIEISVDETDSPTSSLEHLYFALELRRREITIISLAPRFIGEFEKGVDYKGDLQKFEASLKEHVAIARDFGPYKISVHSGSDKFSIYPVIGRVCGELLHVKTAGTSYLEALRVIARQDKNLFGEIIRYSAERFPEDKASYHISVRDGDIPELMKATPEQYEDVFLEQNHGRQLLHVTFGSVLTRGKTQQNRPFKEAILEILQNHEDVHKEVLQKHLGKHLSLLDQG